MPPTDRRRAARFVLTDAAPARLHVLHDVIVERSDASTLTVLSPEASVAGEALALRLRASDGRAVTLAVRTVESRPVMAAGGGVRYRLDLEVTGRADEPRSSM